MLKILHTADVHFNPDNKEAALESLNTFSNEGKVRHVDLFAISGDLYDQAITNTDASGLPALVEVISRMLEIAPVVAITGTPTHDIPGCYDILQRIKALHEFTLIQPGMEYHLIKEDFPRLGCVVEKSDYWDPEYKSSCLIMGCPEPDKAWLLSNMGGLGKSEADRILLENMNQLFLGFAALRNNKTFPCLFLYHGNVSGSMLQNGQILQPGSISIGKDNLAMIGADYYALGHIHLYQKLANLPAYYAGSVSPVNWGETDQKAFNYVELEVGNTRVEKVLFPHSPRKKIVWYKEPEAEEKILKEAVGFQAWVDRRGTKEELAFFDANQFLEKLLNAGALPGSRVTTETIPVETVRAAEIQDVENLQDKLRIYAECSGQELTPAIREKAVLLEGEARKEGFHRDGAHIRLQKVGIRGAKGFWKKQRKDEVWFDFDSYDPGLIALIGENGMGKTTLIENCHTWLEMLTRPGSLQSHFRLRDSYRDLYWVDEHTGTEYRAFIQIDGKNKSGSIQPFLYKKVNGQFVPYNKEITGRQAAYESAILELWGSKTLYLKSAFMAQKPTKENPDLADAGKTGNKELFIELAGLDYYQKQSELAKGKADVLEAEIGQLQREIDLLQVETNRLPETEKRIKELQIELFAKNVLLEQLKKEGCEAKELYNRLQLEVEQHNRKRQQITSLSDQNQDITKQLNQIQTDRKKNECAKSCQVEAEKKIKEYEELHLQESKELAEQKRIDFNNQLLKEAYLKARESYQEQLNIINDQLTLALREKGELESSKIVAQNNLKTKKNEKQKLDSNETCPTCGQVLPKDTAFIIKQKEILDAEINKFISRENHFTSEIKKIQTDIERLNCEKKNLPCADEPDYPVFDSTQLAQIAEEIGYASLDIEKYRQILKQAETAEIILRQLQQQETSLTRQLEINQQQITALQDELSTDIDSRYKQAGENLENLRTKYSDEQSRAAAFSHEKQLLENEIDKLQEKKAKLTSLAKERAAKQAESADWRWLQAACGRDGIQALELDALAPAITGIANDLLAITDDRYSVEIRTTRLAGKGSKVKQIEDFSIWIHDQVDDSYQELSTLSGGESVWMKKAIYDAFGISRAKNTGLKFLTAFQDEADGALHPRAKHLYMKMVEQAHIESGRYQTLIITHSPDVQQSIRQKVDIGSLGTAPTNKQEVA